MKGQEGNMTGQGVGSNGGGRRWDGFILALILQKSLRKDPS